MHGPSGLNSFQSLEVNMLFDNKQSLRADQLNELRAQNLINDSEFAYIAGDLLVAENVTTSEKRVLGKVKEVLLESQKRVLKG